MRATKIKINAALLLAASLAWSVALGQQAFSVGESSTGVSGLSARIDKLVEAWQPVQAEHRLDDIGWATDIREALRLAKENNRPIFLFTYSGSAVREHAMALQRC